MQEYKKMILSKIQNVIIENLGLDSGSIAFLHFLGNLNTFETLSIVFVLLLVFSLILGLFLKLFWRILKILLFPFIKKKKTQGYVVSSKKEPLPDSLSFKKSGLLAVFNFTRLFKGMVSMARIEEDIKKDKPVRLNLSQAIFMIQNFGRYNYFASEDGKILFEKIKRDITTAEQDFFSPLPIETTKDTIFTEGRLKEITNDNVLLQFNEDGNITSCIDKESEKAKISGEIIKEIEKVSVANNTAPTNAKMNTNVSTKISYESWSKKDDKKVAESEVKIPQKNDVKIQEKESGEKAQIETAKSISAKDLKRQNINKKKQTQKESDKMDTIEMEKVADKLDEIDPSDFYDDEALEYFKNEFPKAKPKESNKILKKAKEQPSITSHSVESQAKEKGAESPVIKSTTEQDTESQISERAILFVKCQCTKEDLEKQLVFFDENMQTLFFRKKFFIRLGKPDLLEKENFFWQTMQKKFGVDFMIDAKHKDYPLEKFISVRIDNVRELKRYLDLL